MLILQEEEEEEEEKEEEKAGKGARDPVMDAKLREDMELILATLVDFRRDMKTLNKKVQQITDTEDHRPHTHALKLEDYTPHHSLTGTQRFKLEDYKAHHTHSQRPHPTTAGPSL